MNSEQIRALDIASTIAGLLLIVALGYALVTGSYDFSQWKLPAVVGGVGLILALPFRQVRELVKAWREQ